MTSSTIWYARSEVPSHNNMYVRCTFVRCHRNSTKYSVEVGRESKFANCLSGELPLNTNCTFVRELRVEHIGYFFSMKSDFLLKKSTLIGIAFGSVVRCCSSVLVRTKVALYYNDVYEVVLPPTHRFPMNKYKLVREGYALQLS